MMKNLIKKLLIFVVIVACCSTAKAGTKTFIHQVDQLFSGAQSPDDARIAAIAKAKREIIEKAGTYLESLTVVKNNQLIKNDIISIANGILETKVLSQQNYTQSNMFGIRLTLEVTVDTNIVKQRIDSLLKNEYALEELKKLRSREKDLLKKIEELERKNNDIHKNGTKIKEKTNLKHDFKTTSKKIEAEWFLIAGMWREDEGLYDKAMAYYDKAIEYDPNSILAYNNKGWILFQQGNFEDAISNFSKAIEIDKNYVAAYSNRGEAFNAIGLYTLAISDHNNAITLGRGKYAQSYNGRGNTYYKLGNFNEALLDYSQAITIKPKWSLLYLNRGSVYFMLEQYQKAINDFNKVIYLNPYEIRAYVELGNVYYAINNYGKSFEMYTYSINSGINNAQIYRKRGDIYNEYIGDKDKALMDYTKAISLDPEYYPTYFGRGLLNIELQNFKLARDDLLYYYKMAPAEEDKNVVKRLLERLGVSVD